MSTDAVVLEAFVLHLEDHLYREWTAAMDAAEAATWEPIRRRLAATRDAPTWAEQQAARRHAEPWQLKATPDWPPIRIPGGAGRYLTYEDQDERGAA